MEEDNFWEMNELYKRIVNIKQKIMNVKLFDSK